MNQDIKAFTAADYPVRLTERVTLLGNPLFSVYLVRGDEKTLLIESGISATVGQLLAQLKGLGLAQESISGLLITHAHADHCAGVSGLRRALPNLEILGSAKTADLLSRPKILEAFLQDDRDQCERLARLGFAQPGLGPDGPQNLTVDRVVEPGQKLDLGGLGLEVIDAPGHAPGGLAFWEPGERMIFCADYLGFFLPPDKFVANFYADLDAFLTTFQKLIDLEPHWLCPGHSGAYGGAMVKAFITGSLAEISYVYDAVISAAPFEQPPRELEEDIFQRHYQGICELFTPESMAYCTSLLIRRVLEAKNNPGAVSLE